MATCREAEAVAQVVGAAIAPPWFAAAMANILAPIRSDIANLRAVMDAQFLNQRIFARNHKAFNAQAPNPCPYTRPYKVAPGFAAAPPIPIMVPAGGVPVPVAAIFAAPPPEPGPHSVPPPELPFLHHTTSTLSQAQIGYLSRWYNDTFGIVVGDDHATQLRKLTDFLCGS